MAHRESRGLCESFCRPCVQGRHRPGAVGGGEGAQDDFRGHREEGKHWDASTHECVSEELTHVSG